jgi:hypothetical protein
MTLRTVPSDRAVRTRLSGFGVDLGTRYVTICVVSRLLQEGVGEALCDEAHGARIVGGGGRETRLVASRVDLGTRYVTVCVAGRGGGKLSAVFLQPIQNRGLYQTEE